MKARNGFTLVEILIVVVILGILAAIVIPQFTEASTEAKQSSLVSDLQTARSQIELYKIQHNDNLPGSVGGAVPTEALFNSHITGYTTVLGAASTAGAVGAFGPYLQKIPSNPFCTDPNGVTVGAADPAAASTAGDGWYLNSTTGQFFALNDLDL
jgi:general secretion pathway protein G